MRGSYILEPFGPLYPDLGASVAKFRRIENPTREQRVAHADAIEKAILAKQRQALQREVPSIPASCESGTWHNNADGKVGAAIRQQHRTALFAYVDTVRRERTPKQWEKLYKEAMKEKGR